MKHLLTLTLVSMLLGLIVQQKSNAASIEDLQNVFEQTNNYSRIRGKLDKPVYNFYGAGLNPRSGPFGISCLNAEGFTLPVAGHDGNFHPQQDFGPRTPVQDADSSQQSSNFHEGLDFGGPTGSSIFSTKDGVVISAKDEGGGGNMIFIDHGDGVISGYGHLSDFSVAPGDTVTAGQKIGLMGSTGLSSGPHLHFLIEVNGERIDPYPLLFGDEGNFDCESTLECGPDLRGNNNAEIIFNFFLDQGFPPELAAAFVGNFFAESSLNPAIENSIGAYGLAQWLGSRRDDLNTYAAQVGGSPSDIQVQLNFVIHELNNKESGAYASIQSAGQGLSGIEATTAYAEAVMDFYERPAEFEKDASRSTRYSTAISTLNSFSDSIPDDSWEELCGVEEGDGEEPEGNFSLDGTNNPLESKVYNG